MGKGQEKGAGIKESNVIGMWGNKYPSVVRWLGKVQEKERSAFRLWQFCEWAKIDPEQLLSMKADANSTKAEELLDSFVSSAEGFTNAVKFNVSISVRSFFRHNYKDLAKASGKVFYTKKKPTHKPSREELGQLWKACYNPRDRSILTFVSSSAIAKETVTQLKWKHFERDWEKQDVPHISIPQELVKGHGLGKYSGVRQETFITPEAKEDLIAYRQWMEKKMKRKFTDEDNVFLSTTAPHRQLKYSQLARIISDLKQRTGLPYSLHDSRRYVETALEEININPNWARKIRGRKVRGEEAPYSQPAIDQLRAKYREAIPKLEFTKEVQRTDEGNLRIKMALDNLRGSGLFPESYIKKMEVEWLDRDPDIAVREIPIEAEALQRIADREGLDLSEEGVMIPKDMVNEEIEKIRKERLRSKTATNGGCSDGKHCQKIVSEEELPKYLAEGWKAVMVCPSGKIVVER